MSDVGQPAMIQKRRGYETTDAAHAMLKALTAVRGSTNNDVLEGMIRAEYIAAFGIEALDQIKVDDNDV